MSGWVKLHRKLLDNPVVCKDAEHLAIWMYLLLNATHTNYDSIFKGERITLTPGQLITGRKSISSVLKINENKVQRVLKTFENEQQIEQQTSNQNRLITILNWNSYQGVEQQSEQQVNNERTTSEQQVNTNKNDKKEKNDKNVKKNIYAEFVSMTEDEYLKLTEKHGEILTRKMVDALDNYKGSTGKKYKSDYRAILSWVEEKVLKEGVKGGKSSGTNNSSDKGNEKEGEDAAERAGVISL